MTALIEYTKSKTLTETFPEFSGLTIYGTVEYPLFLGSQVHEILGIVKIHYSKDYDLGDDYVVAQAPNKEGHVREQNMFTEQGLYHIIFKCRTDLGRKFRKFVTIILRELRTTGQVTLNSALGRLQVELATEKKTVRVLDEECDRMREKEQLLDQEFETLKNKLCRAEHRGEQLWREKGQLLEEPTGPSGDVCALLWEKAKERKFLTPIYFIDIDKEDTDPADDDHTTWQMSKTRPDPSQHSFTVHTFKDITAKQIYDVLIERDHGVKTRGVWSNTRFHGSVDSITDAINHIMLS